jgi:disulfide bond formation protein DsbB
MSPTTSFFISLFSTGTLLLQIVSVGLIILLVAGLLIPKNKTVKKMKGFISNNYVVLIFVASALATAGSLTLSEVLNFVPCKLCWYQRIAMYPMSVISFIALISNDRKIKKYILTLSIIGILIATYHILLQFFPTTFQCNDEVAKCSAVQFTQFGYITIPVMSFSFFLFLILVSLTTFEYKKK